MGALGAHERDHELVNEPSLWSRRDELVLREHLLQHGRVAPPDEACPGLHRQHVVEINGQQIVVIDE